MASNRSEFPWKARESDGDETGTIVIEEGRIDLSSPRCVDWCRSEIEKREAKGWQKPGANVVQEACKAFSAVINGME